MAQDTVTIGLEAPLEVAEQAQDAALATGPMELPGLPVVY